VTRLAEVGLVTVERIGNQKHYRTNRASPVFAELHGLIVKTSGLVAPLRAALAPLADRIRAPFVYGSIAKGQDRATSDIDLMVIADKLDYAADRRVYDIHRPFTGGWQLSVNQRPLGRIA